MRQRTGKYKVPEETRKGEETRKEEYQGEMLDESELRPLLGGSRIRLGKKRVRRR
jgi:hypothetical protein